MKKEQLLQFLSERIIETKKDQPVLVGIDGVDASGKTTLAEDLANYLKNFNRNIIRASIDGFHNPEKIRYQRGRDSFEGYYYDSFNHKAVTGNLLSPLKTGNLEYRRAVFDYRIDSEVDSCIEKATNDSILLMEGVFLFRPELLSYWDIKIFLDVPFESTVKRAIKREAEIEHLGEESQIIEKYRKRYIPGQELYFKEANPKKKADIIIDNTDFNNPIIML